MKENRKNRKNRIKIVKNYATPYYPDSAPYICDLERMQISYIDYSTLTIEQLEPLVIRFLAELFELMIDLKGLKTNKTPYELARTWVIGMRKHFSRPCGFLNYHTSLKEVNYSLEQGDPRAVFDILIIGYLWRIDNIRDDMVLICLESCTHTEYFNNTVTNLVKYNALLFKTFINLHYKRVDVSTL